MAKEKQTCENSTGSRLRENVSKIFDCFLIVNSPSKDDSKPSAEFKYPPNFDDQEIIQQTLLFCFPFDPSPSTLTSLRDKAEHFTFILTDIEGKHRFGFCKLTNGGSKCYCILSFFPWFEIFYKFLNFTCELWSQSDEDSVEEVLMELFHRNIPEVKEAIRISPTLSFTTPDPIALPSIPESRNLSVYYSATKSGFLLDVFASLMLERRVIFTSKSLSVLTSSIHSAEALLRPLHWQHIYIPVMPPHLLDYCLAPMPFLVGVHSSLMPKVRSMVATDGDIIIADIDEVEIESAHNDMERLPNDKVSFLKSLLRKSDVGVGTNLSMAFLRTQARLIGGYRNGLKFKPEEAIVFDEDTFIEHYKSTTAKDFARELVQLQTFKQFVDGRLDMLNDGIGFRDTFENEVNFVDAERESDRDNYKEWLSAAKKGGNKLISQFQRKAKDNMKVAQLTIRNYMKQQQLKQQANQKKSLDETSGKLRHRTPPPRPPFISQEKLQEIKTQRSRPPVPARPPPPIPQTTPKPPERKKKALRAERLRNTRRYNTLDLDEDATSNSAPSPSHTTNGADFDITDESVYWTIDDDNSGQLNHNSAFSDDPPGNTVQSTVTAASRAERISDVETTSNQLIDLSVTTETLKIPPIAAETPSSATSDLIGLDFTSASDHESSYSSENWASWGNFETKPSLPPRKPVNPIANPPSHASKPVVPPKTPSLYHHLQNSSPKKNLPSSPPHKLRPNNANLFKAGPTPTPPNYGSYTPPSDTSPSHSHGARSSLNHFAQGNHGLVRRTMSSQSFGNHETNPSRKPNQNNFGARKGSVGNGAPPRGGSLRQQSISNDKELFSDLLGTWKSKEGL